MSTRFPRSQLHAEPAHLYIRPSRAATGAAGAGGADRPRYTASVRPSSIRAGSHPVAASSTFHGASSRSRVTSSWTPVHPCGSGRVYPSFPDPDQADWGRAYYRDKCPPAARHQGQLRPRRRLRLQAATAIPLTAARAPPHCRATRHLAIAVIGPAVPPGSPHRLRSAESPHLYPGAGRPGRRARARRPRWWGWPPGPRPSPAVLAASRQRSSTDDPDPAAVVIGVSSWPSACRKTSSIWVARAAPLETNAA